MKIRQMNSFPTRYFPLVATLIATLLPFTRVQAALVSVTGPIVSGTEVTWRATNEYRLDTVVYVQSNAVLRIEPGTVIKGATNVTVGQAGIPNLVSALWVSRGGKLYATGTVDKPIVFTAEGDDGSLGPRDTGLWGGVVLLGNAPINSARYAAGQAATPKFDAYEGTTDPDNNPQHWFGGGDEEDSSGELRYVSIRHAGNEFAPASELNGLTLGGVGRGTVLEYVEVFASSDDGFEWWGGTVNSRHLVAAFVEDDDFDTDQGYRGTNQFWFGIKPPWAGTGDSRGIESDGDLSQTATGEEPVSRWEAHNVTLVGRGTDNALLDGGGYAWNTRDEAAPNVFNSVFTAFKQGLLLDGDGLYHFTNSPALAEVRNNVWWVTNAANGNGTYLFTGEEYTNTVENPLLGGVSYTNDAGLNPRPQTGSPVYEDVKSGAPVAVGYRGAFSGPTDNWADGWTALSSLGYLAPAEGKTYAEWAAQENLPAGQAGAEADADGDGVLNVVEFALGADPTGDSSARLPAATMVTIDSQTYPAVTFTRSRTSIGVELSVVAASNVTFQNSIAVIKEPPVDLGDGTERMTVRTATPIPGAAFFHTRTVQQ